MNKNIFDYLLDNQLEYQIYPCHKTYSQSESSIACLTVPYGLIPCKFHQLQGHGIKIVVQCYRVVYCEISLE